MKRFVPITLKVNLIIILSLVLGIGSITFFVVSTFSATMMRQTENNLGAQADTLIVAVRNLMLGHEAATVNKTFLDFLSDAGDTTVHLYRTDGTAAFSDNATIINVNENILGVDGMDEMDITVVDEMVASKQLFPEDLPRINAEEYVPPIVGEYFDLVTKGLPRDEVSFTTRDETGYHFRIYRYLSNLPQCAECHGSDHSIRGVLHISSDVTESVAIQQRTPVYAGLGFFGMAVLVALLLGRFLRTAVLKPVKTVGEACLRVVEGDFSARVDIRSQDEIGRLGSSVNEMMIGLHERFELSKYVSSSTLKNLKADDEEGKRVPLTLFFSDIRGFTSYTETNAPEQVVANLNAVLADQTASIQDLGGDIDKYVGDEVVAMFADEDASFRACQAALRIQKEFTEHSDDRYGGLQVGIGINTGEVILGMIGSKRRADYTFIGDNVNIAARLCSAAGPGEILLAESTFELAKKHGTVRVEGPFRMSAKGKKGFIKVYRLLEVSE